MADYYSQRALAAKSQTESSLRASSQRQQMEMSQQASSTVGGGSVQQQQVKRCWAEFSNFFLIGQQVPPGAVMVDGSPVFLTCQDQEVLEVAKAVLREKFPQVMNWLLCVILILVFRWRKSAAVNQVVGRLRCVTLPGSELFSEMRGSCLSLFFTLGSWIGEKSRKEQCSDNFALLVESPKENN